ncbi:MAG: hypothetical protein L3K17_01185 [Thermoplasmata archaeon]|nr:hypothetical protein [Thermoplasmata archaeon]
MPSRPGKAEETATWTTLPDSAERFSTGTAEFDRIVGGGFPRGSMALFDLDETVGPADWKMLLAPTFINFLSNSNGVLAVLPARESPHEFRAGLTRSVSRRLFDTRVRVVDYVGEDDEAPYVVSLSHAGGRNDSPKQKRATALRDMAKMQVAESAIRGARGRMFLELVAFEIMEMVVGPEVAARMFFHGIKRVRTVGNLCLGLLRPGLGCTDAVRGMADIELALHRNELGLTLRGVRPVFPAHLVVPDTLLGAPHISFVPAP